MKNLEDLKDYYCSR